MRPTLAQQLRDADDDLRSRDRLPEAPDEFDVPKEAIEVYGTALRRIREERSTNQFPFLNSLPDTDGASRRAERIDRQRDLTSRVDRSQAALDRTAADVERLETALTHLRAPDWLPLSWIVLVLFSVVGLVFPVTLMVFGPTSLALGVRISVGVAFLPGLGGLLLFLRLVMQVEGVSIASAWASVIRQKSVEK